MNNDADLKIWPVQCLSWPTNVDKKADKMHTKQFVAIHKEK